MLLVCFILIVAVVGLINFFDGRTLAASAGSATSTRFATWESTWESTGTGRSTTGTLVELGDDWHTDSFKVLLLMLEFFLLSKLITQNITNILFKVKYYNRNWM